MTTKVFNHSQQITGQHVYSLLMHMDEEQRKAAVLVLSALTTLVEDGFYSLNKKQLEVDFYVHCFDTILGASLGLRMLEVAGYMPPSSPRDDAAVEPRYFKPLTDVLDSRVILAKIEDQLRVMNSFVTEEMKNQ